ncbi:Linalool 8-monooxygenase [Mycolicibacterium rhodesiae JS60]|nr:Linalool 8-monooxygenase [Mycolicibacterium rhodesiae JS60]
MTTNHVSYTAAFAPETYGAGNPETFGLPLDLFDHMRSELPCVRIEFDHPLLVDDVWCISRHADVCDILTDKRFISSDPNNLPVITRFGPVAPPDVPGIFCQDGEIHRKRRKEIGGALRPATLKRLEPHFRVLAANLVDGAVAKGTFDFIPDIAHALPSSAIGDVLGIPEEDREQFYKWSDAFISPFDERLAVEVEAGLEAVLGIWGYALDAAELKRQCPADDVLTALAQSDASDGEIRGNVATFAAGAAETTRAVLGHAIHELMRNDEQMAWLRAHADDIPATAISELLRIASPVIQQVRTATEDFELYGQHIKAGERVAPLLPAANFDPDAFENPRRFDLTRAVNPHLSFGRGSHICIGKHIAELEIKVVLEELLKRVKDIRPAGEISYVKGHLTRGVYSLPVTVVPA